MHPARQQPGAPLFSVLFLAGDALRGKVDFARNSGGLLISITAFEDGSTIESASPLVVYHFVWSDCWSAFTKPKKVLQSKGRSLDWLAGWLATIV